MGTSIEIRPLTLAIGAEVSGVDLRQPLADAPMGKRLERLRRLTMQLTHKS